MISIDLYINNSEDNRADKQLANKLTIANCNIKAGCNMLHPVLELAYNPAYLGYNYCYISLFNRFYFLEAPDIQIGQRILIQAHADHLTNWKNQIRASEGRVVRSGSMGDTYMVDSMVTLDDAYDIQCRKLGAGFTPADNYILVVGGSN